MMGDSPIMSLDEKARPPHSTLLHVEATRAQADELWKAVTQRTKSGLPVRLTRLYSHEVPIGGDYVPQGGVTVGLQADLSSALRIAHFEVLELALSLGAKPLGRTGDEFLPHVTLGVANTFSMPEIKLSPDLLVVNEMHLAYGEVGVYGTFPRIFFTTFTNR